MTFRPLQDKCTPTAYEDVEILFKTDMGQPIDEIFEDFVPEPIGVASLAQVHVGRYRATGEEVAIKLQHPSLIEFAQIDMKTVQILTGWSGLYADLL
jgi:aarF domain-containing kinase